MNKSDCKNIKESLKDIVSEEYITLEVCNIRDVQNDLINLMAKKNHDYGNAFNKGCNELGIKYALSRLYDKINRLNSYIKGQFNINNKGQFEYAVKDENVLDTIVDLANYCTMTIAWINEQPILEDINKFDFIYIGDKIGTEISLYNELSKDDVTIEINANYGYTNLYGDKEGYVYNKNADNSYVSVTDYKEELVKYKLEK